MGSCYEALLVDHCAPTLAGLKLGSLFCLPSDEAAAAEWVSRCDGVLAAKGLRLRLIRRGGCGQLVYVYRQEQLYRVLQQPAVTGFLAGYGYETSQGSEACLRRLEQRLQEQAFPHEIGVFLGYPLHDVEGFIRHGGRNYCCKGCWKVYACRQEAEKAFACFRRCKRIYRACHRAGATVEQLTIAV